MGNRAVEMMVDTGAQSSVGHSVWELDQLRSPIERARGSFGPETSLF